jgi:putative ABC transport system permease protein
MRVVTLASVRMYARRYVAAGLAVVLGVGFIVSVLTISSAARSGVRDSLGQQYSSADVVVPVDRPRDARALAGLDAQDGVAAASVTWQTGLSSTSNDQAWAVESVASAPELRWQEVLHGAWPEDAGEVAVTERYAEAHDLVVGSPLDATFAGEEAVVSAVLADPVRPSASDVYAAEQVVAAARDAYPLEAVLRTADGVDAEELVANVSAELPRLSPSTTEAYVDRLATELTGEVDVIQGLLLGFALVAVFVAAMVVANTFTIVLAQRSRDVALLRCVGALRGQLVRSVAVEAGIVGLATAAVGVLVGLGFTSAAVAVLGDRFDEVPLAVPELDLPTLMLPWLGGALVTLLSSLLPALRATRVEPIAALRMDDRMDVRSRAGVLRLVAAAGAILAGAAALVAGSLQGLLVVGVAGGMLSFVGVLWMGPVLVPAAVRLLGRPAGGAGVPGRLALANSTRNPRRTAATAMALLVGVTLISMLTIGAASSKQSAQRLSDDAAPLDLAVSAVPSIDASTVDRLEGLAGVEASAVLSSTPVRIGGTTQQVASVDPAAVGGVVRSTDGTVPGPGEVLMPFEVMDEIGVTPGDSVTLRGGGTSVELVARGGDAWGAPLLVAPEVFGQVAADVSPTAVWLRVADDADAGALQSVVDDIAGDAEAQVTGGLDVRVQLDTLFTVLLAVSAALLAVAVLIALVGVGNTLSLSVLERTRENALLRALGLTGGQVRGMLAAEAVLLTTVAAVLGIALGSAYAWFGVRTLLGPEYGREMVFAVPFGQLGLLVVVAVVAGLAASWLPARRAGRTAPVAAL